MGVIMWMRKSMDAFVAKHELGATLSAGLLLLVLFAAALAVSAGETAGGLEGVVLAWFVGVAAGVATALSRRLRGLPVLPDADSRAKQRGANANPRAMYMAMASALVAWLGVDAIPGHQANGLLVALGSGFMTAVICF
jgi:hypothetical protein